MNLVERLSVHGNIKEYESMKKHTTYKIGGQIRYYIEPYSELGLMRILNILDEESIRYFVLGRGSNLLIDDRDFDGAIINLDRTLNSYVFEPDGTLLAQAGCSIIHLSVAAADRSLSGLEFAYGIPGSIGGGLYMNAGAYKSELSDILIEVCVLKDGKIDWMKAEELDYGYRHSAFQQHKDWTILAARFQLEPKDQKEIRSLMERRRQRRMNTQPLEMPCAGSTFRNPIEIPAWELIDKMGFRGFQIGGAMVSNKHSNFIVNVNGEATFEDVTKLIELIRNQARKQFNIELIPEVEYLTW